MDIKGDKMLERHEIEDRHREAQMYAQDMAYEVMKASGELQEVYLRAICESAEIPEEIEAYSDQYDTYFNVSYSNIFDDSEARIIRELLKLSLEDETIDCDKFVYLFDYNIVRYRDANIKANLERIKGYADTITKTLKEINIKENR